MLISGKTVLLTGATGGIGHAIARKLHRNGARLVLTGRRVDVLEPLAQELGAQALPIDLTDRAAVEQLAEQCADVDILIANAGLPASGLISSFSLDEIDRALDVNLRAPLILARLLSERMVARRSGHLLFVSSLAGKSGPPACSVYSATKFGLRGMGQALREDLRASGVGVSVVFPGFISDAGMFADADVSLPKGVGTSTPEQVADGVAHAIERNRGEVDVAPLQMKLGTKLASLAPETLAGVSRRMGSADISHQMATGQSHLR